MNTSEEGVLGQPLSSISANDSTYASGYSGVITFDNTDGYSIGTNATFDNYAQGVPEPGGLVVLAAVIGCAGTRRVRFRQGRNEPRGSTSGCFECGIARRGRGS